MGEQVRLSRSMKGQDTNRLHLSCRRKRIRDPQDAERLAETVMTRFSARLYCRQSNYARCKMNGPSVFADSVELLTPGRAVKRQ